MMLSFNDMKTPDPETTSNGGGSAGSNQPMNLPVDDIGDEDLEAKRDMNSANENVTTTNGMMWEENRKWKKVLM